VGVVPAIGVPNGSDGTKAAARLLEPEQEPLLYPL